MTPFYVAGALLVVAQVLGIYALVTRKADAISAHLMVVVVVGAVVTAAGGAYDQSH